MAVVDKGDPEDDHFPRVQQLGLLATHQRFVEPRHVEEGRKTKATFGVSKALFTTSIALDYLDQKGISVGDRQYVASAVASTSPCVVVSNREDAKIAEKVGACNHHVLLMFADNLELSLERLPSTSS